MQITKDDIQHLEELPLVEALRYIAAKTTGKVVFSTSLGQEDQIITDAIFKNDIPIEVFTLDTGRLFNEHYELLAMNNAKYKGKIKVFFPDPEDVERFVNEKGINAFYHSVENRKECCFIRKVKPLNRALKGAEVWVTGLRAEQSENRENLPIIEWDEERTLYKFNPLIRWTYQEIDRRAHV